MRILLFSSSYAPRTGGLETVTRRLVRELGQRGHDVTVATNRYPCRLSRRETVDGVRVYRQLYPDVLTGSLLRDEGNRLKEVALLPLAPLALFRLLLLFRRVHPDVVNIHYFSYPAVFALVAARILGYPVVLSFHGSDLSSVPYPSNYEFSLRLACRLVDCFTVCSHNLGGYLKVILTPGQQDRVVTAYNGTDDQDGHEPALPPLPNQYVLVASRFVDKKGVDVVIRSIATLRAQGVTVSLVIAGDGPQRTQLERLTAALDISSQITFLGSVEYGLTRALMRRSLFVVVPSYWEAFGMVSLEAMTEAKAVVATRTGGIPEIVIDGETGILVETGDPDALARGIGRLLEDPELAGSMGRRGRARALRNFTWDETVERYLSAYSTARSVAGHTRFKAELGGKL